MSLMRLGSGSLMRLGSRSLMRLGSVSLMWFRVIERRLSSGH